MNLGLCVSPKNKKPQDLNLTTLLEAIKDLSHEYRKSENVVKKLLSKILLSAIYL
jgi:hypothetical protein